MERTRRLNFNKTSRFNLALMAMKKITCKMKCCKDCHANIHSAIVKPSVRWTEDQAIEAVLVKNGIARLCSFNIVSQIDGINKYISSFLNAVRMFVVEVLHHHLIFTEQLDIEEQ